MKTLTTWNPVREFDSLGDRLSRLFDGFLLPARRGDARGSEEGLGLAEWMPAVDITETPKSYLIKSDIPDVKKEDIKVTLQNGVLRISGERRMEKDEKDKRHHRIERSFGSFVRMFTLPEDASSDGVKAECKDGVLTVTVPRTPKPEAPPEIAVKVT
jgi:HSP20 family protein